MMTIYEQRYYQDIAALRRAIEKQNELLQQLVEIISKQNEKK